MPDEHEQQDRGQGRVSPFERIKHTTDDGQDYWSARELMQVLDYSGWQRFSWVIDKAKQACENSGQAVSDHFNATVKMIATGKGAQREVDDVHLSRYACYLTVQNGDPTKPIIALGQTYFAVRTREAEIADEVAGLSEDQRRLYVRDQLSVHNKALAAAAGGAGVLTSRDFAVFQDHGYMGLYGGERARDIHARKGLTKGQAILDHMGSTELAANLFRATQTEDKLRRENIQGQAAANQTHHDVGAKVRQTIAELGGAMPEHLPTPSDGIQQVRQREQRRLEQERQPSLFDPEDRQSEPTS